MMLKVYTKNNCPQCKMTKRMLTSLHIDFEGINLDENPDAIDEVKAMGFKAVPVVVPVHDEAFSGFNINKIRALV